MSVCATVVPLSRGVRRVATPRTSHRISALLEREETTRDANPRACSVRSTGAQYTWQTFAIAHARFGTQHPASHATSSSMSMSFFPDAVSAPCTRLTRGFTPQRTSIIAGIVACLALPATLMAQQADSTKADSTRRTTLGTVRVEGRVDDLRGIAQSASQGRVGRRDLRNRPMSREGEVLENIPGMILTQHSGDGKANQMFVRGFNLDHGTDFQTRIESMPINMPTHAHGQGYSDLNMLIPELVDHLEYKLGPYYAELGDFGSAGGATLQLVRSLPQPIAHADVGAWGFARTVAAASTQRGRHSYLLGGEVKQYDGPWDRAQGAAQIQRYGTLDLAGRS